MIEEFLKYLLAEKRYSELTIRAYGDDIRQFVFYLGSASGDFDASMLTPDNLRAWIVSLSKEEEPKGKKELKSTGVKSKKGLKSTSVNRKISSVKSFCHFLRQKGYLTTDPFQKITSLKTPRRLPSFIEESRMRQIMNSIATPSDDFTTERDALIILLFYSTGIRLAELTNIRRDDFSNGFDMLKVKGKGDKERIVPVINITAEKIKHYLQLSNELEICGIDNNFVFLTHKGEPLGRNEIYRIVRDFLRAAGVQGKSSPHVLRHTFATHLLNSGADIRVIQELLGHSSLEATQVYTHNSIEQLKKVYNNAHPRAKLST